MHKMPKIVIKKNCEEPDRDDPKLKCGYPLPCPHHVTKNHVTKNHVTKNHAQKRAADRAASTHRFIDEDTQSIGRGALELDVKELRVPGHTWTDDEINRCWDALTAVYGAFSYQVMMRNSHLYLVDNLELNDSLYIGETSTGPAMSAKSVRKLRDQGMRTIEEVIARTCVPYLGGEEHFRGFRDVSLDALPPPEREIAIRARQVGKPDRRQGDRRGKPRRVSDRSRLATGKRHKR